jgi:hypothetical protein
MKSMLAFFAGLSAFCFLGQTAYAQFSPGYGDSYADTGEVQQAVQAAPIVEAFGDSSAVIPASHMSGGGGYSTSGDSPCDGSCGGSCTTCCSSGGGFECPWHFYGEFLYFRPRDSEIAWGTQANSNIPAPPAVAPVQIGGRLGVLDQDFQPGWRFGLQYNMTECSGVSVQYTMYEASTNDFLAATGANVITSMVSHPAAVNAAQNVREGRAGYGLNYDLLDVDYHKLLWYDCDYQIGYMSGVGAVQMEQTMLATFAGNGVETVRTDIDFYGVSARFGLEGEGAVGDRFRVYAKGIGNLVAGEFRADYDLGHSFDAVVVDTSWRAGRIVGIWNLETGFKWVNCDGNLHASLGYMFSAWTNTVQTDQWIRGVQSNYFADLDDTMTFDGLVARFEARF